MQSVQQVLSKLIGLKVSHVWRGHGSALFLELGELSDRGIRKDGSQKNPVGEVSVMADFGWRIERKRSICLASGESNLKIESASKLLVGSKIVSVQTYGRLPELQLEFSNSLWLLTFSQYQGQPSWAVILNSKPKGAVSVKNGKLCIES